MRVNNGPKASFTSYKPLDPMLCCGTHTVHLHPSLMPSNDHLKHCALAKAASYKLQIYLVCCKAVPPRGALQGETGPNNTPGLGGSGGENDVCRMLSVLCSALPFVFGSCSAASIIGGGCTEGSDVAPLSKDSHVAGAAAGKLPCGRTDVSEGSLDPGPWLSVSLPAVMASGSATSVAFCKHKQAS